MKHVLKLLLLMGFFGFSACHASDGIEIVGITQRPLDQSGWHHQTTGRVTLELLENSFIATPAENQGSFLLWASNNTASQRALKLVVAFSCPSLPDVDLSFGAFTDAAIELPAGAKIQREYSFRISQNTLNVLRTSAGKFGLRTIKVAITPAPVTDKDIFVASGETFLGVDCRRGALEFPDAKILRQENQTTLSINGQAYPGNSGFVGWNWGICRSPVKQMAAAGRHLYKIHFQPWSLQRSGGSPDAMLWENKLREQVNTLAGLDPNAMIMIHWLFHVPPSANEFYPGEMVVSDNGSTDLQYLGKPSWSQPSIASPRWRREYAAALYKAITLIRQSPYADRVFLIQPGFGNAGEWNGFFYKKGMFEDYSEPMRQEFIAWLQTRYGNINHCPAALAKGYTEWSQVRVPDRASRLRSEWGVFRDYPAAGIGRDYYEFLSDYTASSIELFGKVIKEASEGRLLSATAYGYLLHHLRGAPFHSLDSGHFALHRILDSPYVDVIIQPQSTTHDLWQSNIAFGTAVRSIQLSGKLFMAEVDPGTHLAKEEGNPAHRKNFLQNAQQTLTYFWRDYARLLTLGASGYYLEFNHGFYDFPEFGELLRRVEQANRLAGQVPTGSVAEVAVVFDEQSVFDLSMANSKGLGLNLFRFFGLSLDQAGAPADVYLSRDLAKVIAAPTPYKLVIMANHYRRSAIVEDILRRYSGNILWLYGAGFTGEDGVREDQAWTGIRTVCSQEELADTVLSSTGNHCAVPQALKPRLYVDDSGAEVLATFADGKVAFARKSRPGGYSMYCGIPYLSPKLLREVYTRAGIHSYCEGEFPVYVNRSFIAVFLPGAEPQTEIVLPHKVEHVVDLWSGEIVATDTNHFSVHSTSGYPAARLYYYGMSKQSR